MTVLHCKLKSCMWLDLLKSECFTMNCAMIKKLPAGSDGVVFENNVEDIVNRKESKALRAGGVSRSKP